MGHVDRCGQVGSEGLFSRYKTMTLYSICVLSPYKNIPSWFYTHNRRVGDMWSPRQPVIFLLATSSCRDDSPQESCTVSKWAKNKVGTGVLHSPSGPGQSLDRISADLELPFIFANPKTKLKFRRLAQTSLWISNSGHIYYTLALLWMSQASTFGYQHLCQVGTLASAASTTRHTLGICQQHC